MDPQTIDLSAGLVPATPAPAQNSAGTNSAGTNSAGSGIDLSAGLLATSQPNPITDNPNREGLYQMVSPDRKSTVGVPYSKNDAAINAGYAFANDAERKRYLHDYSYDPNVTKAAGQFAAENADPTISAGVGVARGVAKTATGAAHVVGAHGPQSVEEFASESPAGFVEGAGETAEGIAEFLMGDEALKGLSYAEKLKQTSLVMKAMEKSPILTKAITAAMRQGAVGGVQGLVKSGGDVGTGAAEGALAGGTAGAAELGAGLISKVVKNASPTVEKIAGEDVVIPAADRNIKPTPQQEAGQRVYKKVAQNAVEPHLEAMNAARPEPRPEFSSGPEGVQGEPTGEMTKPTPQIDVRATLNRVHDFSNAADELEEAANQTYDKADAETQGKFRSLNKEVRDAQSAAWKARGNEVPEAQGRLAEAINNRDELLNSLEGTVDPEELDTAKRAFRQSYVLRDVSNALDRSWNGVPGTSARSQSYRGFDGHVLANGLKQITRNSGRKTVEAAIGADGLDNLERIAELNRTLSSRQRFGAAIDGIAKLVAGKDLLHIPVVAVGGLASRALGVPWEVGALGAEGAYRATNYVMKQIATNPKIGQNLIFALQSGARPEKYVPFIAQLIAQNARQNEVAPNNEE